MDCAALIHIYCILILLPHFKLKIVTYHFSGAGKVTLIPPLWPQHILYCITYIVHYVSGFLGAFSSLLTMLPYI